MKLFEAIKVAVDSVKRYHNLRFFIENEKVTACYIMVDDTSVTIDTCVSLDEFEMDDGWKIEAG